MKALRMSGRLALMGAAALVMLFGGSTASFAGPETCNPDGRAICITITDTDDVSPSGAVSHYMRDTVTVRNGGGSALSNVVIKITLTDTIRVDPQTTTTQPSAADFVEAESTTRCTVDPNASNILNCTSPNLAAGDSTTLEPLVFRTSNAANVISTETLVYVKAKEPGNKVPKPKDPTNEEFSATENTNLELDPNAQRSWVFPGASVPLRTSPIGQFSIFPVNVPLTFGTSFVAELVESPASTGFCSVCFGEQLTTVAPGVFNATNIVEIQSVIPLDVTGNANEQSLTVRHRLDSGFVEDITTKCGGEIDSGTPPSDKLSCRRVDIDHQAGTMTVEAFSKLGNGQWGFF